MLLAALLLAAANFGLAQVGVNCVARQPRPDVRRASCVGNAVKIIESRLPYNQYPAFWFQESAPDTLEYQAVMCAFLSHGISMQNFPVMDHTYTPG